MISIANYLASIRLLHIHAVQLIVFDPFETLVKLGLQRVAADLGRNSLRGYLSAF
jgi:hypothetical protein